MVPASPSVPLPVSSVPISLQSPPAPPSPQPKVQRRTPTEPPLPELVLADESPGQRTVEVAIPNVGTFVIESEEGGYDDEVALAPPPHFFAAVCACLLLHGVRAALPVGVALHEVSHAGDSVVL